MEKMGSLIDLFIMVAYFAAIMGFGAYFGRFTKNTNDFFFGGKRFAWWLITASIVATGIGSHSFVKYATMGAQYGFSASMSYINDWFFMPLFLFGWMPLIYFTRVNSIPEYFEKRFDVNVRLLTTVLMLIYLIGYIGIGYITLGKALKPILDSQLGMEVPLMAIAFAVAIASTLYVTAGGQTAVIFTDLAQGGILIFAGFLVFFLGIAYIGGFSEFWANFLPAESKLWLADFNRPPDFNFIGIFWQDGVANSIGFLFMNQGLMMRFLSIRSVDEGRKAVITNTLFLLPLSAVVVAGSGWIAKALIHQGRLDPTINPDSTFTIVLNLIAMPGVFGFLMAALVAALMSTVDTLVNATSAIWINDVYRPYLAKNKPDKHYLNVARISSIVVMMIGIALVPIFNSFGTLYRAHATLTATVTPPMIVTIFLGAFCPRFTTKAAIWSIILGSVLIAVINMFFPEWMWITAHGVTGELNFSYTRALFNLLIVLMLAVPLTFLTRSKTKEELDGLGIWSVTKMKERYKGGKPNYRQGVAKEAKLTWKIMEMPDEYKDREDRFYAILPQKVMEDLALDAEDMVYLADARKWLGGLRSLHARVAGSNHNEADTVYISANALDQAQFLPDRPITIMKIM